MRTTIRTICFQRSENEALGDPPFRVKADTLFHEQRDLAGDLLCCTASKKSPW